MNISIIGSGNCATALGTLFRSKGHSIRQVMARNTAAGEQLAALLSAEFISFDKQPATDVDLFLISLSDTAFPEALKSIDFKNALIVHTAGAIDKEILKDKSNRYGVLYPLQSFRKELPRLPNEVPFLIAASDPDSLKTIKTFAESLSDTVFEADREQRLRLHAAAVIVNNFTNYLYSVAKDFCDKEKVDFNLLKPLIHETAYRMEHNDPGEMQTGPAVRKDIVTLEKHLKLLSAYPKLKTMYMRMTDSIMNP